jgi:hypothetical protein
VDVDLVCSRVRGVGAMGRQGGVRSRSGIGLHASNKASRGAGDLLADAHTDGTGGGAGIRGDGVGGIGSGRGWVVGGGVKGGI